MTLLLYYADGIDPNSWEKNSRGWPKITHGNVYDMYIFANCVFTIPYGSYVLVKPIEMASYRLERTELRVHPSYIETLKKDYDAAGRPTAEESSAKRLEYCIRNKLALQSQLPHW